MIKQSMLRQCTRCDTYIEMSRDIVIERDVEKIIPVKCKHATKYFEVLFYQEYIICPICKYEDVLFEEEVGKSKELYEEPYKKINVARDGFPL